MKTIAAIALIFGIPGAAIAYGQSETRTEYVTDWTLNGDRVVVERTVDRLGLRGTGKIIGYFGGGHPRAIGFGCEGADMPTIAVEAKYLPRCKRVEAITY